MKWFIKTKNSLTRNTIKNYCYFVNQNKNLLAVLRFEDGAEAEAAEPHLAGHFPYSDCDAPTR